MKTECNTSRLFELLAKYQQHFAKNSRGCGVSSGKSLRLKGASQGVPKMKETLPTILWVNAVAILFVLAAASITDTLDVKLFGLDIAGAPSLLSIVSAVSLFLFLILNGILCFCRPRIGRYLFLGLNVWWAVCSSWDFLLVVIETRGEKIDLTFLLPVLILIAMMRIGEKTVS